MGLRGRSDPLRNPRPTLRRVHRYIAYRIGDTPEAEDVLGDVVERALRFRHTYDPARGAPATWMIGIARRVLADRRPLETVAEPPDVAAEGSLEDDMALRLTLRSALGTLSERDRELIALRYGADLSTRQIAGLLDLKPNTVDVALKRALARLRLKLEALDDEGSAPVRFPATEPVPEE